MSLYGGTVTAQGRNMIASLVAGEDLIITKVIFGSGKIPEDTELMNMEELINPIATGTSDVPVAQNGIVSMVVEYRNDLNGGLKEGFWLNEFGIFAKTEKMPEVLLYYATLGDSPQPVSAFRDNRIDVRRYPVAIEMVIEGEPQTAYAPGAFVTSEEFAELHASHHKLLREIMQGEVTANLATNTGEAITTHNGTAIVADKKI